MTCPASFRQSDLTRALRGAIRAGMEPCGCRIHPGTGEIELSFDHKSLTTRNGFDSILGLDQ